MSKSQLKRLQLINLARLRIKCRYRFSLLDTPNFLLAKFNLNNNNYFQMTTLYGKNSEYNHFSNSPIYLPRWSRWQITTLMIGSLPSSTTSIANLVMEVLELVTTFQPWAQMLNSFYNNKSSMIKRKKNPSSAIIIFKLAGRIP